MLVEKNIKFQRKILQNRSAFIAEINKHDDKKNMTFTENPLEEAMEYAVLEFPFSFWQWGGKCDEIPDTSSCAKEIFDYINKIVGIGFYNDKTYVDLLPSYYQHMTELGYYGFDTDPVKDLLKIVLKGGSHKTRIKDFSKEDQQKIYNQFQKWLGSDIKISLIEKFIDASYLHQTKRRFKTG